MLKVGIVAPRLSGTGGTETVIQKVINHGINDYKLFVLNDENNKEWLKHLKIKDSSISTSASDNRIMKFFRLARFVSKYKYNVVIVLDTKLLHYIYYFRRVFNLKFKIISWIHYSIFDENLVNPDLMEPPSLASGCL